MKRMIKNSALRSKQSVLVMMRRWKREKLARWRQEDKGPQAPSLA
jgi:hypothetical protein